MPRARVRVVLASRVYAPESAAATFRLTALVQSLVARGAEVEVLTVTAPAAAGAAHVAAPAAAADVPPGSPGRPVADQGARVRRWPVLRDASGYVRGYLPYLSFDLPLALRLAVIRRPDVVVVEPPPTTGAVVRTVLALRGRLGRRPVRYVYYAADVWSDASASTGAPAVVVSALRVLERYALRGAHRVVAVSAGVAERVGDLGGRPELVQVVPNGIDTDTFTPDGPVAADAPGDTAYLVYAGTASEWQGAEIFAEAMPTVLARVPGARVVFLGQGSSWPALRQIAARVPRGAVELRPLVPPEEAAAWLRGAAGALVSVKPGLGYDFAYPTKVLAALACGTAVVFAGPGPAAADLAAHELGEAVPYDVASVARAMVSVLERPAGPAAPEAADACHRRRAWVVSHRSLSATGAAAADVVLRAADVVLTAGAAEGPDASPTSRTGSRPTSGHRTETP